MEDRDIIELYFDRDERAIAETERKYGKLCHSIAHRIVGNVHDADECVNDTYLGVWQAIPPQRPISLCAFVAKVARNIAIGRLKYKTAEKRNSNVLVSLSELEEIIPHTEAFDELEDKEIGHMISDFLYGENEETRRIFVRKYWYFDTIEELSEKYGYSESKIKSILFRTRNKLKGYLAKKGVEI